jgi:hypothetical protein
MGQVRKSRDRSALLLGCVLMASAAAALVLGACTPPPEEPDGSDGSGGDPTTMTPNEVPSSACGSLVIAGCDTACTDSAPCAAGLFCRTAGVCGADCQEDDDCIGNDECTDDGRCVAVSNIILDPQETDPDKPLDEVPECIEGQVEFEAIVPEVSLLLDRSGSMTGSLGTVTRWEALGLVLLGDPDNVEDHGVVGDFEDRVAFGASFYTTGSGPSGCALDLESVAVARNNYRDIRQRYSQIGPTGWTPTGEAVRAIVANALLNDLSGGPKILVLATDGAPGTCAPATELATTLVENEVASAFEDGMQTFAIAIDTGTDAPHMQRVANLGVGLAADADPPAPYFTAESQEELELAFSTILADVPRSCVFSLNGEVDPDEADEGTVILAGEELGYEDSDGWVLAEVDQVELVGSSCDQIRAGEEDLDISFPCSVFTPVVK